MFADVFGAEWIYRKIRISSH